MIHFDRDDRELLIWGGVALLVGVAIWKKDTIQAVIMDTITRGKRLTYTDLGDDGQIPDDPADLAAQAADVLGRDSLPQDVYDLARMARSEKGNDDGSLRVHIAINDAESHNWSTHFTVTYSTNATAKGRYGEQFTPADRAPGGVSSTRRYSTAQDPYEGDVTIVEQVLLQRAQGIDPTGGAVKFVDRAALSSQEGARSYDAIVASWAQEGLHPFNVPGYPDDFVVFRKA